MLITSISLVHETCDHDATIFLRLHRLPLLLLPARLSLCLPVSLAKFLLYLIFDPLVLSLSDYSLKMTQQGDTDDYDVMPLHCQWTLFYDNPRLAPEGTDWAENLKTVGVFDNTEDFWRIFNNVKPSSAMALNSNYHLFRTGIQPMWEDPSNIEGGKFVLTIPKKDSKSGRCDEWWLYTVLAMIGETMDLHGDQVAGAVVSIRKSQDRIALWLKSSDPNICIPIGERWKKALEFNKTPLKYQFHKDGTIK